MDWQQIASLIIVVLSATLIIRSQWQRYQRARTSLCSGDCGCAVAKLRIAPRRPKV